MRYLYEPGEIEGQQYGGEKRGRSIDPIWLVDVYKIKDTNQPTLDCLNGGPKRSFVFEELQTILLFDPISYLVLSMLIHSQDWVLVDSNLPYPTPVISNGEQNYIKKSFFDCLVCLV